MAKSYKPKAPPQFSPDGQWWWNGYRWIPGYDAPAFVRSSMGPPTTDGHSGRGIHLGGTAQARFERRFILIRRIARYLAALTFAGAVVVAVAGTPNWSLIWLLDLAFVSLVVVSLARLTTISVVREITIAAPPHVVFGEIEEPENWGWGGSALGSYREVQVREELPSGGTRGRLAVRSLGLPSELSWDTLKYEPPARLAIVGRLTRFGIPRLMQLSDWSLRAAGEYTEVGLHLECQFLTWPLLSLRAVAERLTDRTMAALARSIEGQTPTP